ncbi:MAG: ATP-dependent Clp protease adaptor ClpS [Pirellulales bacterium]|nr:ATP-dependent Clp protease adaptor ClpS [Pirellulales bacterium]
MSSEDSGTAVVDLPEIETVVPPETRTKDNPRRQPPYNVVLWNDDDHTFEYVVHMMQKLFGHTAEQGAKIANEVDQQGRTIVLTTTREHAELKRDQIHAFGKDNIKNCKGSMKATIEPAA